MNNLDIWNDAEKTDPAFTKEFTKGGGFSGTSINPTYMAKMATKQFGPMGIGWGIDIVDEQYKEGGLLVHEEGKEPVKAVIHTLQICLWYKLDDDIGKIYHFGQTPFISKNKYGITTDEEAPKKSLTDATTKALSMLGFGADIFTGQYDDVNYVESLKNQMSMEKADDSVEEQARQETEYREWQDKHYKLLETAASTNELQTVFKMVVRKMNHRDDKEGVRKATEIKDKRKAELEEQGK